GNLGPHSRRGGLTMSPPVARQVDRGEKHEHRDYLEQNANDDARRGATIAAYQLRAVPPVPQWLAYLEGHAERNIPRPVNRVVTRGLKVAVGEAPAPPLSRSKGSRSRAREHRLGDLAGAAPGQRHAGAAVPVVVPQHPPAAEVLGLQPHRRPDRAQPDPV